MGEIPKFPNIPCPRIEDSFRLRPKHWYQWINPFWWQRQRTIYKFMKWHMKATNMDEKLKEAMNDMMIYGRGVIKVDDVSAEVIRTTNHQILRTQEE